MGLQRVDENGVEQVVFYDAGVGTDGGGLDKVLGGGFGAGIDKNIIQLYTFLAMNYEEGDEIYMIGFSRGAYTVRSLAGMINDSGLVRRKNIQYIQEAYDLYRKDVPRDAPECVKFREAHGKNVPITLLACFDTVGSLGIPSDGPLGMLTESNYQFHNTTLGVLIENAIHMVSIDEERRGKLKSALNFLFPTVLCELICEMTHFILTFHLFESLL